MSQLRNATAKLSRRLVKKSDSPIGVGDVDGCRELLNEFTKAQFARLRRLIAPHRFGCRFANARFELVVRSPDGCEGLGRLVICFSHVLMEEVKDDALTAETAHQNNRRTPRPSKSAQAEDKKRQTTAWT